MRLRTILSCLVLVLVLVVAIIPANVVAASDENAVNSNIFAAAGIKSGETFTIYFNVDGSISKFVKGAPKSATIDSQALEKLPQYAPLSDISYTILSPISSGSYSRGTVPYTTTHIYYHDIISAGCSVAFGAYNVTYYYFTGTYLGPYDNDTWVTHDWYGSQGSGDWEYEVYNGGPSTCYITGKAKIYY